MSALRKSHDLLQQGISSLWRADQLGHTAVPALSSSYAKLDRELPGAGWPMGMVTELITREAGIGELRLLVPLLRQLTSEGKVVILLAPPHIPYAPALASFGIDIKHLIIIQAPNAADRLWAVEQTLKSASFGALLAWLPQDKTKPAPHATCRPNRIGPGFLIQAAARSI
jgi:protein ImuA